jgi:hypothetical protein
VGAIVFLVGLVLVGSGFIISALAQQAELNCTFSSSPGNTCQQTEANAQNTSIAAQYVIAGGAMVSGVGGFIVIFAMVSIMARRGQTVALLPPPPSPPSSIQAPQSTIPPPPPTWDQPYRP